MVGESRRVFISYARSDATSVNALVEGMRQLNYEPWIDQQLTGGQEWWDAVLSQIRASSAVLIAVSRGALESVAVRREYEYGHAVRRPLLPVIMDSVQLELLPPLLAPLQAVNYWQPGMKGAFALAAALAALPAPQPLPQPLPKPPPIPISTKKWTVNQIFLRPWRYKMKLELIRFDRHILESRMGLRSVKFYLDNVPFLEESGNRESVRCMDGEEIVQARIEHRWTYDSDFVGFSLWLNDELVYEWHKE
jgi:hypothetical protein